MLGRLELLRQHRQQFPRRRDRHPLGHRAPIKAGGSHRRPQLVPAALSDPPLGPFGGTADGGEGVRDRRTS